MKYKSLLLIVFFLLIFNGCVPKQNNDLSIQEQIELNKKNEKSKTHIFKNRTKLEVLNAIDMMMNYLDKSDLTISYFENRVVIKRRAIIYAVFSFSNFDYINDINIKQDGNNIILTSSITSYESGLPSGSVIRIENGLVYDFFYNRLEYFLNIDNFNNPYKWISCDESRKIIDPYNNPNSAIGMSTMCFMADDIKPNLKNDK